MQVTRNAGGQWTNVTANLPGLPPLGTVSNIEPSRFDPGTAYLTVDLHQVNNRDPFIYKTTDYGRTWKSIAGDLPKSVHSYAHCVREDPVKKGMLYLGTENALYFSMDDGLHWLPLQAGLPHAPVHWLTIQERFNDLVVATYGRGFFILDDITTLRQLTPQTASETALLFAPRAAYRFRPITDPMMMPDDPTAGKNPPDGAPINFWLKSAPAKDADGKVNEDAVTLSISDASGQLVRTMKVAKNADAGVNRVWWDLRGDPTREFKLRTSPLYAPEFKVGPDGTRKLPTAAPMSVLVPPGTYTVKLKVGGQAAGSPQTLVVKKDPNTSGTEADIEAQTRLMLEIRANMDAAADLINQAEVVRARLSHQQELAENDEAGKAIKAKATDLDKKIVAIESRLFNMTVTGRGQDQLRLPSQIVEKLGHLADVVSLNDFGPTDQALVVHKKLLQELSEIREQIKPLLIVDR